MNTMESNPTNEASAPRDKMAERIMRKAEQRQKEKSVKKEVEEIMVEIESHCLEENELAAPLPGCPLFKIRETADRIWFQVIGWRSSIYWENMTPIHWGRLLERLQQEGFVIGDCGCEWLIISLPREE